MHCLDKVTDHQTQIPKEAVIYLSLEHPNIARLFDVYEDEEQALSFVMKFENQPFKTQLLNTHAQGAKIFWHSATSYHHISIRPSFRKGSQDKIGATMECRTWQNFRKAIGPPKCETTNLLYVCLYMYRICCEGSRHFTATAFVPILLLDNTVIDALLGPTIAL